MDIFLQILDENWLDDTKGRLVYRYSQKCIAIRYLFRVNPGLPVYQYIVAPLLVCEVTCKQEYTVNWEIFARILFW